MNHLFMDADSIDIAAEPGVFGKVLRSEADLDDGILDRSTRTEQSFSILFPIDIEFDPAFPWIPAEGDMVPAPVGDLLLTCHRADPADVEAQMSIADEEGLSIVDPPTFLRCLGKETAVLCRMNPCRKSHRIARELKIVMTSPQGTGSTIEIERSPLDPSSPGHTFQFQIFLTIDDARHRIARTLVAIPARQWPGRRCADSTDHHNRIVSGTDRHSRLRPIHLEQLREIPDLVRKFEAIHFISSTSGDQICFILIPEDGVAFSGESDRFGPQWITSLVPYTG